MSTTATADDTKAADTKTADTTSTDTKTADTKAADSKTVTDTTAKAADTAADTTPADRKATEPHVPESYALTLPEKSPLTGEDLDRFRTEAKTLGLTNAQAQKYVEHQNALVTSAIQQLEREHTELKADPDIGGAHFEQTVKSVRRGMQEFFGADFQAAEQFFAESGFGNKKLLVKAFAKFGAQFKEDGAVAPGSSTTPTKKSPAEVLYGTPAS